ncbi:hypothetical protein [Nocardia sp. NPDC057668]|uniref:hypothetical protein n=1 Tax=Nocardia sp. NPDC057668 TaxID=3346202 RepID=UPI00366AC14E
MAVVHPIRDTRTRVHGATVGIAGSAWPVFKLEALGLGLAVALLLLLITGAAQTAVLAGATVAALRWIAGAVRPANHKPHRG